MKTFLSQGLNHSPSAMAQTKCTLVFYFSFFKFVFNLWFVTYLDDYDICSKKQHLTSREISIITMVLLVQYVVVSITHVLPNAKVNLRL